jgi:hypothetical protein
LSGQNLLYYAKSVGETKMALFKRSLIPLVLSGQKTQTRRAHKRRWIIGHTYKIKDQYLSKGLGTIKITRSFKQRLGDISEQDAQKEGFANRMEFIKAWTLINKGTWNPETVVTVYEFVLIEKRRRVF